MRLYDARTCRIGAEIFISSLERRILVVQVAVQFCSQLYLFFSKEDYEIINVERELIILNFCSTNAKLREA